MSPLARLLAGALLLGAFLLGAVTATTAPAAARSCAEPSADLAAGSDLVFSGVVRDRRTSGERPLVTVRVDQAFKGEVTRRIDVLSVSSDAGYEITAQVDDEVVVFARLEDGEVFSGLCTVVVGPGRSYERVLRDLGAGTAPADGYLKAESAGLTYDQWKTGRFVFGLIGLSFMAFLGFRAVRAWWARRRTSDGA